MRFARLLSPTIAACGLLLAASAAAAEDPYDRVLARFRDQVKTAEVDRAVAAVRLLDPANPRSLPELLDVLRGRHWALRGAAMEALAEVPAGPLRSEMRLALVTAADPWIRDGVAHAMSIRPEPGDGEALVAALDDADWRVRRTTARALGEIVSRAGVERLVRAAEEEPDLRVLVWVRASLRAVSGTDMGREGRAWRAWWERHKDRPEWSRQGDEVLRSEFAGVPLETVTLEGPQGTDEEARRRRERPDLYVLAPFGWTHDWFRPYLDEAAEFVRVTYVTLPTVPELTGHTGFGSAVPVYPVDRLAAALEAFRAETGKERVILMAAGPVAWIAEKYALRHPEHVTGLVLVDGWLDATSYSSALLRAARQGSPDLRWAAATLIGRGRRDAEEGRRLRRVFLTESLSDPRDTEAYRLWRGAARDHGFATVPDLVLGRRRKIETPTLWAFPDPELAPMSGAFPEDLRRIREAFDDPPPVVAVLRDTRGLAHVEDPAEFLRVVEGFLEFAGVLR